MDIIVLLSGIVVGIFISAVSFGFIFIKSIEDIKEECNEYKNVHIELMEKYKYEYDELLKKYESTDKVMIKA